MRKPLAGTLALVPLAAAMALMVTMGTHAAEVTSVGACAPDDAHVVDSAGTTLASPEPGLTPSAAPVPSHERPIAGAADGPGQACAPTAPSGVATPSPDAEASAPLAPEATATIEIDALDLYYSPAEVTVPAEGATRMVLTNRGYATHNLTIDELGIELVVGRGGRHEVTLGALPPGTYSFYCSVSGHREAGMEGTLIIE